MCACVKEGISGVKEGEKVFALLIVLKGFSRDLFFSYILQISIKSVEDNSYCPSAVQSSVSVP